MGLARHSDHARGNTCEVHPSNDVRAVEFGTSGNAKNFVGAGSRGGPLQLTVGHRICLEKWCAEIVEFECVNSAVSGFHDVRHHTS